MLCDEDEPPHDTSVSMTSTKTGAASREARFRLRKVSPLKPTSIAVEIMVQRSGPDGRLMGEAIPEVEPPEVATVTVTDCAALPLICTDELDKLQVGPAATTGVIAQLRSTVPLKVPDLVRLRLKLAVCPALTGCDMDFADTTKSEVVLRRSPRPLKPLYVPLQGKMMSIRPSPFMSANRLLKTTLVMEG